MGHNNYQARGGVPHLTSMPTLPNCPTFSSLLSKDYSHEVQHCNNGYIETCPPNDFITRKRSFYVLATMLVLGIIVSITQNKTTFTQSEYKALFYFDVNSLHSNPKSKCPMKRLIKCYINKHMQVVIALFKFKLAKVKWKFSLKYLVFDLIFSFDLLFNHFYFDKFFLST